MIRRHVIVAMLATATALLLTTPALATTASLDPFPVEIHWSDETPLSGTVSGGRLILDEATGGIYPLIVIDAPHFAGDSFLVNVPVDVGEIRSPGYLEMWTVLADGSRYFSRSFDAAGVGVLQAGQSVLVRLPFELDGAVAATLELNAVLPGGGHLEIGPVAIFDIGGDSAATDADAWWSQDTGGLIGGLTGGLFGVLGALIGSLTARTRARRFVTATVIASISLAALAIVFGIVAIASGQPYQVWFPLLLGGTILGGVFGGLRRQITARYESAELQKIRALDLV